MPSFSLFNYFSVLSNLQFLFFGVPALLQLRVLNLSLFWENMPNCPADDNLLYPCSVPFPLLSLTLEHSSFIRFLKNLSHESSLPLPRDLEWRLVFREHISLWGERGFVSNTVSQYFIFIRVDWVTSSLCVGKDDCVCNHVLGPGSLGVCGSCSTGASGVRQWLIALWQSLAGKCCFSAAGSPVTLGRGDGIPVGWQKDHSNMWEKEGLCCSIVGKCGCL